MANTKINYADKIEKILVELPDFVSDFIYNFGRAQNYATKYQYVRDIKDFLQFMVNYMPEHSEKSLREITLSDMDAVQPISINRYMTLLTGDEGNGCKLTTVKRRRASLSSMYGFFLVNNAVKTNPVLATKPVKIPEKNVIYLTNDEQKLLLETIRTGDKLSDSTAKVHNLYADRDSAMFLLMLDTGLRVSEMIETNIIDYDFKKCSVVVRRKGGDVQNVYYSDECAEYLDHYFSSQRLRYGLPDKDMPAFSTTTGKRLGVRAVETLVKKYVEACMPEKTRLISPHKLRSSFAMSFYEASGNDILLLQKKLNHKSIQTTNIYAKASDQALKESRGLLQGKR